MRTCLPKDLPKLMVIEEWFHKEYVLIYPNQISQKGVKPSEYETFPMIARVLVSKDTSQWKPSLKPNSNWRNWKSGDL